MSMPPGRDSVAACLARELMLTPEPRRRPRPPPYPPPRHLLQRRKAQPPLEREVLNVLSLPMPSPKLLPAPCLEKGMPVPVLHVLPEPAKRREQQLGVLDSEFVVESTSSSKFLDFVNDGLARLAVLQARDSPRPFPRSRRHQRHHRAKSVRRSSSTSRLRRKRRRLHSRCRPKYDGSDLAQSSS